MQKCQIRFSSGETITLTNLNSIKLPQCKILFIHSREFGKNIDRNELEVIGCGTIGRVYRYDSVVFKVQIPGIIEKIKYNYLWLHKLFVIIDFLKVLLHQNNRCLFSFYFFY